MRIFLVKILAEFVQILDLSRTDNMRPRESKTPGSFGPRPLPLVSQSAILKLLGAMVGSRSPRARPVPRSRSLDMRGVLSRA